MGLQKCLTKNDSNNYNFLLEVIFRRIKAFLAYDFCFSLCQILYALYPFPSTSDTRGENILSERGREGGGVQNSAPRMSHLNLFPGLGVIRNQFAFVTLDKQSRNMNMQPLSEIIYVLTLNY